MNLPKQSGELTARGLTAEELPIALLRIATWRADNAAAIACPRCGWEGLFVIDLAARPDGDHFSLTCADCGLDARIEIPANP